MQARDGMPYRRISSHLLAFALALLIVNSCAAVSTNMIVLPPDAADRFGNGSGGIVAGPTAAQLFYDSKNFSNAAADVLQISAIAFRLDEKSGGIDVSIPQIYLWVSTFEKPSSELSKRPESNWGDDRKLVLSKENLNLTARPDPSNPSTFQIQLAFQEQFVYDRTRGGLLFDLYSTGPYVGSTSFTDSDLRDDAAAFVIGRGSSGEPVITPFAEVLKVWYTAVPKLFIRVSNSQTVELSFMAASGQSYALEVNDSVASINFWNVLTNIPAIEAQVVKLTIVTKDRQQYFRVRHVTN